MPLSDFEKKLITKKQSNEFYQNQGDILKILKDVHPDFDKTEFPINQITLRDFMWLCVRNNIDITLTLKENKNE